jgi:hypothetical protein
MLTLFFLVVEEGGVFPVEINEGKNVVILKEEINKKAKLIDVAHKITIYQAKKDGHWLPSDNDDVSQLSRRDVPVDARDKYLKSELVMNPTSPLMKYFSDDNIPRVEEIHGLVLLPVITETFTHVTPALSKDDVEMAVN